MFDADISNNTNTHTGQVAGQISISHGAHDVKTCYCCWVELKKKISVNRNTKEMCGSLWAWSWCDSSRKPGRNWSFSGGWDKTCGPLRGKGHWFKAWTWTSWTDLVCTQWSESPSLPRNVFAKSSLLYTDQVRMLRSLLMETQTTGETIWGKIAAKSERFVRSCSTSHLNPDWGIK